MAFNHKFLATKSWHVRTPNNIAAVEAAEASAASLSRRVEQRKAILAKERALQATQALRLSSVSQQQGSKNAAATQGPIVPTATSVAFMYEPPPGFVPVEESEANEPAEIVNRDSQPPSNPMTEDVKPFISSSMSSSAIPFAAASAPLLYNAPPPADGVVVESHSARRERHRHMTPQQIRDELHPALKGAPVTADYVREGSFRPNPLGIVVRDVRCLRCGGIGHASGDRECPKFAQPSLLDAQAMARDDPVTKLKALAEQQQQRPPADSSAASSSHVPLPPSGRSNTVSNGKFKLMYNDEDWTAGGLDKNDPLQQVLIAADDEEADTADRRSRKRSKVEESAANLPAEEAAFLASLSEADMKLLLKQYKQARKSGSRKSDSSSASSDSSSSSSISNSDSSDSSSDSSSRRRSSKHKKHHKRSKKAKKSKSKKSERRSHRSSRSSRSPTERDESNDRKHKREKKRKRGRTRSHSASPRLEPVHHSVHQERSEPTAPILGAVAAAAATPAPAAAEIPSGNSTSSALPPLEDDLPPLLPY